MFRGAAEGPRGWSEQSRGSAGEPGVGPGRAAGRICGSTREVAGEPWGVMEGETAGIQGSTGIHSAGVQGSTGRGPGRAVGEAPRAGGGAPREHCQGKQRGSLEGIQGSPQGALKGGY